ncbi:phage tail tube protein [Pseudescherichia vulneris]|uniref:phage tail tube protein n=1 Tax=Pseudescherichia vulneris TaxID=566 RepID=UPI001EDE7067|nr:phage tail tube protein [Pseudescherichia vulneris]
MSVVTQGTQLYVFADGAVSEVECITALSPGGNPADQIDDTCLSDRSSRKYKKGLRTPGAATVTLNADPANPSHLMLHRMAESDSQEDVTWVVGWADGESAPTVGSGAGSVDGLQLPEDRTWFVFKGQVTDFPFDFAANTVVATSASIQRSGPAVWVGKVQAGS